MRVLFAYKNAECIGIEYLMGTLRKEGHQTALYFESGSGETEIKSRTIKYFAKISGSRNKLIKAAKEFKPDLIAISCLTNLYPWLKQISEIFKKELGNIPIIAGGIHPTILTSRVLRDCHVDFVCRGEGEECLSMLCDALENRKDFSKIPNLAYINEDGMIIANPIKNLLQNLDELPYPYKRPFYKYGCFSKRIYICASRGCPYNCSYCFNPVNKKLNNGKGNWHRLRSVDSLLDELRYFYEKYKYKEIFFYDDVFAFSKKWLREFAPKFKKHIALPYKCLLRPDYINEETIALLAESGCIYTDIGIESGNEEIRRRIMNRDISNDTIIKSAKLLKKYGIKFTTLNMLGVPGETKDTLLETYSLNKKIKPDGIIVSTFYPYPGTKLLSECIKKGYADKNILYKIYEGEGSYKFDTILKHPLKREISKFQNYLPIAIRLPDFLGRLILKLPVCSWTRIISIFFLSVPRNMYIRLSESIRMFIKSNFGSAKIFY
jgi:radical SAM superfamily enzyme YgiQ (UPF0313 family)